jgi:trehalose/maltose hydrolase-like predicted phosphorylase
VSYPGTYMHGGFNRETTIMGGVPVLNEVLVNLPKWHLLELRIEGEDAIGMENIELLSYRHEYDIRYAVLRRELRFRDRAGRKTTLVTRRFVSMADKHQATMEWEITPEDWSGRVEVVSALDGRVTNRGDARYQDLEGRHVNPSSASATGPDVIGLRSRTRQSRVYIGQVARTRAYGGESEASGIQPERTLYQMGDYIQQGLSFEVREKRPVRVEKLVSFYASRDYAINEPLTNARRSVARYETFSEALRTPPEGLGRTVGLLRRALARRRAGTAPPEGAHLPRPPGLLAPHGRPRRRGPRPGSERRGALHLPIIELPVARDHARAPAVPLPAARGGAGGYEGGRIPGCYVPLAERL